MSTSPAPPANGNGGGGSATPPGPYVHNCLWCETPTFGPFGFNGDWARSEHRHLLYEKHGGPKGRQ
jgi:hypothetical protein